MQNPPKMRPDRFLRFIPFMKKPGCPAQLSAVVLLASLAVFLAANSDATAATRLAKTFKSWTVFCMTPDGKAENCAMSEVVQIKSAKTRRPVFILAWSIRVTAKGKQKVILRVPLGVSLAFRIAVQSPLHAKEDYAYELCTRNGCFTSFPLTDSLKASMKKGDKMFVSYKLARGREIKVALDLKGFSPALDFLLSEMKKK